MKPEIKKLWVDALRSGEYKQGTGRLRTTDDAGDRFCCLGVLCDLYQKETGQGKWVSKLNWSNSIVFSTDGQIEAWYLPNPVEDWADFDSRNRNIGELNYDLLLFYNDKIQNSFEQIANLIEGL